jgi:hypothetical protein
MVGLRGFEIELQFVIAGLDPAIDRYRKTSSEEGMRGSSSANTRFALLPAHDEWEQASGRVDQHQFGILQRSDL